MNLNDIYNAVIQYLRQDSLEETGMEGEGSEPGLKAYAKWAQQAERDGLVPEADWRSGMITMPPRKEVGNIRANYTRYPIQRVPPRYIPGTYDDPYVQPHAVRPGEIDA